MYWRKSENVNTHYMKSNIHIGLYGGRQYKRMGAGGESICSAFTFRSGGCTNLHIYMRMTNRHQHDSLIGLTSYKHLYCSSTHRWACMLSLSIIAMWQQSDIVCMCVCASAQVPHPHLQMKIINPHSLIFMALTNDSAAVIY